MTTRGPQSERDEELGALMRLLDLPDFQAYLTLLRRHAEDLRRTGHRILVDEKAIADHNYRTGQVDGLMLASRLPDLIRQVRSKIAPDNKKVEPNA